MKIILLIALFSLMALSLAANNSPDNIPQKVYSITRQDFALEYYIQQSKLWQQRLEDDRKDADAWLNYYTAQRMIKLKGGAVDQAKLDKIVEQLIEAIPNSFERYHISYWNSNLAEKDFTKLQKAYEIAPDRYEIYGEFVVHYEKKRNQNKVREFCTKWIASGEYSAGILNWNYNVLIGLDQDAILLTQGDNDTYPVWLLQYTRNIRPDVTVLNIHLAEDAVYRNALFEEKGIATFDKTLSDFEGHLDYQKAIIEHLFENKNTVPVYMSVPTCQPLVETHKDDLYITGLTMQHSKKNLDNLAILKNNYEHKFMLDYLRINLYHDISQSVVDHINMNYLPAFLLLHKHYNTSGEFNRKAAVESLILKIADAAGRSEEIRSYLQLEGPEKPFESTTNLSHKDIESWVQWIPTLSEGTKMYYMGNTEVSIWQYEQFLMDLLKQKEYDKIQKSQIRPTDWRSYLPEGEKELSDDIIFMHGHSDDISSPVQNISYEAATLYCEWLTNVYNNLEHKKKRYKKVLFRLPTEKEWIAAAKADGTGTDYGWSRNSPTNEKGCYLANFNVGKEPPCEDCPNSDQARDGLFFPGKVTNYFPNDFGLYNTIGNVAEMIQEQGKAKGGSWNHSPKESTLNAINTYNKPEPYIGFRVLMEVIE